MIAAGWDLAMLLVKLPQYHACWTVVTRLQEYSVKVARPVEDEPFEDAYPALVVSVGSGVSIIKVRSSPQDFMAATITWFSRAAVDGTTKSSGPKAVWRRGERMCRLPMRRSVIELPTKGAPRCYCDVCWKCMSSRPCVTVVAS